MESTIWQTEEQILITVLGQLIMCKPQLENILKMGSLRQKNI